MSDSDGKSTPVYACLFLFPNNARRQPLLLCILSFVKWRRRQPDRSPLTRSSIERSTDFEAICCLRWPVVPFPPCKEQLAIVRFLDHAERRIRRYIRAKERLIELLEEQKQAIIHQAVTGQIDVRTGQPYPAYKDSSVEWLGKVPQALGGVGAPAFDMSNRLGKMLDAKRIVGEHLVPYLRNVDVQWDGINSSDLPRMDIYPHEIARYTLELRRSPRLQRVEKLDDRRSGSKR